MTTAARRTAWLALAAPRALAPIQARAFPQTLEAWQARYGASSSS